MAATTPLDPRGGALGARAYLALGAIVGATALIHSLFLQPIIWGMIEYEAWLTLQGKVIYRDFFEFKTPGAMFITSLFFRVFGASDFAVQVEAICVSAAVALLVFRVADAMHGRSAALAAAVLWLLWAPVFKSHMLYYNLLSLPFSLLGFAALRSGLGSGGGRHLALSGVFSGCAFLVKQTAAANLMVSLLAVLWLSRGPWRRRVRQAAGLGSAAAAVVAAAALLLLRQVPAETLFYYVITYPLLHVEVATWNEIPLERLLMAAPIFLLAAPYVARLAARRGECRDGLLLVMWLAGSLLHVKHNLRLELLISFLPFLCLAAGWVVVWVWRDVAAPAAPARWRPSQWVAALAGGALVAASAFSISCFLFWGQIHHYLQTSLIAPMRQAGEWVARHTPEDRKLFVLGGPSVYFHARRAPATVHLNMEPSERRIRNKEQDIISALEADPDAGVVYFARPHVPFDKINSEDSWTYNRRIEAYILERYRPQEHLGDGVAYMVRK